MHSNTIRGMIAQNKAELRAIEKGYLVSKPITECARYDMIIDDGERRERVQVKYAGGQHHSSEGSCVVDLRCKSGRHTYANCYNRDEIDAVLAYIPVLDKLCYLPVDLVAGKNILTLRYAPTKNGQTKGILFAEDYLW